MKRKTIEKVPVREPLGKTGIHVTAQKAEGHLILDAFKDGAYQFRHAINLTTAERESCMEGVWNSKSFYGAMGGTYDASYCEWYGVRPEEWQISEEDKELVETELHPLIQLESGAMWWIPGTWQEKVMKADMKAGREQRVSREKKRLMRIDYLMEQVPAYTQEFRTWMDKVLTGGHEFATKSADKEKYVCSVCEKEFALEESRRADSGKKLRHNDLIVCPHCSSTLKLIKRGKGVSKWTKLAVLQNINDDMACITYIDANVECHGGAKYVYEDEAVRIILNRRQGVPAWEIYYNNNRRGEFGVDWDNWHNHANRREFKALLFPEGITEALAGTRYEQWTSLFNSWAQEGRRMHYNNLMASSSHRHPEVRDLFEMLYRNRFYRIMEEESNSVSTWNGDYFGKLMISPNIRMVFGLDDKQAINRLRDINGSMNTLSWLQYAERHHTKVSDKVLKWLNTNNIDSLDLKWLACRMTLEQACNYITRQCKESYTTLTPSGVISQYNDYMDLIKKEGKDTTDSLNYRPANLKLRHDEAVERRRKRLAAEQWERDKERREKEAENLRKKFPQAEEALHEVKEKFTWENDNYMVIVPETLIDILFEGQHLHHCAGGDRYYDRMAQRETFIVFLRKKAEPETPYYTLEVEPTGTVRQNRGMYDREPDIEKVRPVIKEWQKAIQKRMKDADREAAKESKRKRLENDKFLREKSAHPLKDKIIAGLARDLLEVC